MLLGVGDIVKLDHDPVVLGLAGGVEPRLGGCIVGVVRLLQLGFLVFLLRAHDASLISV